MNSQQLSARKWDVIVIGTGIGGATIGYSLARAGLSVLFCEKGVSHLGKDNALTGDWAESFFEADRTGEPLKSYLRRAGRQSEPVQELSPEGNRPFVPMLGIGTGGSSALYGMVLERFFPEDFVPGEYFRGVAGAQVPDAWPIGLSDLQSYYEEAETLYRVRATRDPLRASDEARNILPPPAFSPANAELYRHFEKVGMHPYHVPMACDYKQDCRECIGFICTKRCKGDSANICLEPAIRQFGAVLADECDVVSLSADKTSVTKVNCSLKGEDVSLQGRIVVLAAGALQTPALLLRSANADWPNGLANHSDQVGRNLMRHFLDYYIVYPANKPKDGDLVKQLAINDLYVSEGVKLGTLQSNGRLPPARSVAMGLRDDFRRVSRLLGTIFPTIFPAVELAVRRMLRGAIVLASIMEDLPYPDNRVSLKDGKVALHYEIRENDRARLGLFRRKIGEMLKPYKFCTIKMAERNRALGHICGTCRFGDSPGESVLDRNNKAHGIENLFVVDSSFFPTSSGTNPSLTIAANSLRVADHIKMTFGSVHQ